MAKKKQITQIILLVSGFWFLVSPTYAQSSKHIRVAIIQDAASIRLKVKGFYEVIDSGSNKILGRGKNLNTTVTAYSGGVLLGNIKSRVNKLFIKSDDPDAIVIDGREFRGNIQLIKKDNAHLLALNHIHLEDYIKGILYHEISHYWPQAALKAQAIVVRTYAAYQMQENSSKDYDVTSDVYSQVYGGRTSERERTNKAVNETRGQILTYQDKVFPAYYHATCGGHTEDASLLWNIDILPLKGVICNFCKESPHFSWHYVLSLAEIKDKLVNPVRKDFSNGAKLSNGVNAGYKIVDIKEIVIGPRDNSGRITDLKIISAKENLKVSAKDFRNIMSPNIIRSTNFEVNVIDHDAIFEGFGWGHGVGLCQWGAYFMAKQGYTAEQILKYYYPDSNLTFSP